MIYTFYGRVSSDSDEQLQSLENQEEYWIGYFNSKNMKLNPNVGVFYKRNGSYRPTEGYYIDEGISGYKSKKYRKAYLQMIEDAKLGRFNMIYTRSISRFGRNVKEILETVEILRSHNVGVYFEDINANTLDPNDNFKLLIFAGIAEEESRLKSASVQRGKRTAAKKGIWSGREPYGYNIADSELYPDKRGQLVINQTEAEVVREIFDLYINQGWGYSRIAKHLNNKEVLRKRGAGKWDTSIIGKMLSNPIYNGVVWLNRTYIKNPQKNIVEQVPEDQQVKYDDESLRIIDQETYERVQRQKEERSNMFGEFKYKVEYAKDDDGNAIEEKTMIGVENRTGRYSGTHPFSNLLRCGNCGGTLRYKKQKSTSKRIHHYWFCVNNERYGACQYRNLQREEELIEWVKQEIHSFRDSDVLLNDYLNKLIFIKFDKDNAQSKIEMLTEKLNEKKNESEFNFQAITKKYISESEYAERAKRLTEEIKQIEKQLESLKHIDREIVNLRSEFNKFVDDLNKIDLDTLDSLYKSDDKEFKQLRQTINMTLRQIISKIVFTTNEEGTEAYLLNGGNEKRIHWRILDEDSMDLVRDSVTKYELERLNISNEQFTQMLHKPN